MLDVGVAYNHHDVSRGSELINEGGELLVADHHRLELEVGLDAAELELLDDIANLLKAVNVFVLLGIVVRDHEES